MTIYDFGKDFAKMLKYFYKKDKHHEKSLKTCCRDIALEKGKMFIDKLKIEEQVCIQLKEREEKRQICLNSSIPISPRKYIKINKFSVDLPESLLDTYRLFYKNLAIAERTIQDYQRLEKYFIHYKIDWIDLNDKYFDSFIQKLKDKYITIDKSRYTVTFYNYCRDFITFLNHCKNKSILPEQLVISLKQRILKKPKNRNQGHSKIILNNILQDIICTAINDDIDFSCYLYVLYITTSRVGEIAQLKKNDFLSNYNVLEIRQSKTSNYKLLDNLNHFLNKVFIFLSKNKEENDYLFNGHDDKRYYANKWREIMIKKGLTEEINNRLYCCYEMRCIHHTSATFILDTTDTADILRHSLGHKRDSNNNEAYTGKRFSESYKKEKPSMCKSSSYYGECTIRGNSPQVLNALEIKLDINNLLLEKLKQV